MAFIRWLILFAPVGSWNISQERQGTAGAATATIRTNSMAEAVKKMKASSSLLKNAQIESRIRQEITVYFIIAGRRGAFMRILILEEFKSLVPPLAADEFSLLEANIIADGCREPLSLFGRGY
jgi:hypothetical protein